MRLAIAACTSLCLAGHIEIAHADVNLPLVDLNALQPGHGLGYVGRYYGEMSGLAISGAGDVNGDGIDDFVIGGYLGFAYVVFGNSVHSSPLVNLASLNGSNGFIVAGPPGSGLGMSVASAGDFNGDGIDDLIFGDPEGDTGDAHSGNTYVVFGKAGGFSPGLSASKLDGSDGFVVVGTREGGQSGYSVSSAGDVNGDGFDDIVIGSPGEDNVPSVHDTGAAYVIFGRASGQGSRIDLSDIDGVNGFRLACTKELIHCGQSVASGDFNGDGFSDILLGAPAGHDETQRPGLGLVLFGKAGPFSPTVFYPGIGSSEGFSMRVDNDPATHYDLLGFSVSGAGDVNGDGIDDLVIGAPGDSSRRAINGRSYVVFGRTSAFPTSLTLALLNGIDGFAVDGVRHGAVSGGSVASAGDVNGDGYDDVIISRGRTFSSGKSANTSFAVFGKPTAFPPSLSVDSLNGVSGFKIFQMSPDYYLGTVVSSSDVNGDGFSDLLVGAPNNFIKQPFGAAGESFVVYGGSSLTTPGDVFSSSQSLDGTVIETRESSGRGGTVVVDAKTLTIGDDQKNRQSRAVLSFDTSSIPDDAGILGATLFVRSSSVVGKPYAALHGLTADISAGAFGSLEQLESIDFQSAASQASVMTSNGALTGGWLKMELPASALVSINKIGPTQIRLRFKLDDDNDGKRDAILLKSAEDGREGPQLIVNYSPQ